MPTHSTLTTDGDIHKTEGNEMTNEQTIDAVMKAAADLAQAEVQRHNMPSSLRAGVCERKGAALRQAITAALAAKDAEIERLKAQPAEPAKPESGEWIEWRGGECPIADGVVFQFKLRDGSQDKSYEWTDARDWIWADRGHAGDIVAYRVLP